MSAPYQDKGWRPEAPPLQGRGFERPARGPQVPAPIRIGRFIADFLSPQRALIVEVDGDTHDEGKDRLRDDILLSRGYRVVRVANDDVMSNMDGVLQHILIVLNETPKRWNNPHPNPSPEGEGLERAHLLPSPSGEGPGVGRVSRMGSGN